MSRPWEMYYEYQLIEEKTWAIRDSFGDYCYLLEGKERALLIDAGIGLPGLSELVKLLTDKPIMVLLTHGHLDHIGSCGYWQEILIHEAERETLYLHQSAGYRNIIHGLVAEIGLQLSQEAVQSCIEIAKPEKIHFIKKEKEKEINLGDRQLEMIETPGHTGGSICLWEPDRNALYSGDTVCEKRVMLSFPESCSAECYCKSLEKLMDIRSRIRNIYAGHNQLPISPVWIEYFWNCGYALSANINAGQIENTSSVFGKCQIFKVGSAELTCHLER